MLVWRTDENNDVSFGHNLGDYAKDAESVAQRVKSRLQLLKGEWFLDTDAGVPYLQRIMTKPADIQYAKAVIMQTILDTTDVVSIDYINVTFDHNTRELNVQVDVITIYSEEAQSIEVTV